MGTSGKFRRGSHFSNQTTVLMRTMMVVRLRAWDSQKENGRRVHSLTLSLRPAQNNQSINLSGSRCKYYGCVCYDGREKIQTGRDTCLSRNFYYFANKIFIELLNWNLLSLSTRLDTTSIAQHPSSTSTLSTYLTKKSIKRRRPLVCPIPKHLNHSPT